MTDERQAGLREALAQDNPARLVVWQRGLGWLTEHEAEAAILLALAVAQVPAQEEGLDVERLTLAVQRAEDGYIGHGWPNAESHAEAIATEYRALGVEP